MIYNHNIECIAPSKSLAMSALAKELKKKDPEIIDLSIGEPDFDTPAKVVDEACYWLKQGFTHYTTGPGLPELRKGIADKLRTENGCSYEPDGIIVCPGGKFSIYLACATMLNPGDEVIIFAPYWVSYPSIVDSLGAVPVTIELSAEDGYRIHEEVLRDHITKKTRLIIINYPNNPSGKILLPEDFQALRSVLLDYPELVLLSDEMYESIIFDGNKNISPASDPLIADRVITSNGFSKCAAMTGWRIGYIAADKDFAKVATRFFGHTITQTCGFIQKAALKALDCKEEIEQMRSTYEIRRNLFTSKLKKIPGLHCDVPEGSFYVWVGFTDELVQKMPGAVPGKKEQSEIVSEFLLRQGKVSSLPGVACGMTSSTFVRFCFAVDEKILIKAADMMEDALRKLY